MSSPKCRWSAADARVLLSLLVLGAAAAGAANAADIGAASWSVRVGGVSVEPSSSSQVNQGTPAEGTVEFQEVQALAASATYKPTHHWGIDLWVTAPANSAMEFSAPFGHLTVAHADLQQNTLSLQYRLPVTRMQPYVGAGVNLTRFSGEQFTAGVQGPQELRLKNSAGAAAQAGLDIPFGRRGLINAEARFAESSPVAFVDGTRLQTLQVDPWCFGLYAGWRF